MTPEILARVHRGGRRFLVVFFPPGWTGEADDLDGRFELLPEDSYWWLPQAVDRTLECAA